MSYYPGSTAGYLNPVAIDRVQHPNYDQRVAENTVLRVIQWFYPLVHNITMMLETLCKENEFQRPTDLQENLDYWKQVFTAQIDWNLRGMMGSEEADELNAKLNLHEEYAKTDGNEHHSILNWDTPYQDGTLTSAPPATNPYMMPQYQQQQTNRSWYNPLRYVPGAGGTGIQSWQLPPPKLAALPNGEQFYSAEGGPPPLAAQQGYTTLPQGAVGWSVGTGQPIDYNGQPVASTGERILGAALTKFL
jgi:hypothetical protein|tara:strand:- start:841 stop:1581 length:741 start_codon:yes stop_codon:yes gene_type:complete